MRLAACGAVVIACLGPIAGAQTYSGTMTVRILPSSKPPAEELARHELGLRKMGASESQIEAGRAESLREINRLLAGIEATGPFEFAWDGDSSRMLYVHPTPVAGSGQYSGSESYIEGVTISNGPSGATIQQGDHREFAPAFWRALFCGTPPAGAAEHSTEPGAKGPRVAYRWISDELIHELVVEYADEARSIPASASYGIVTPPQFVKPGVPPRVDLVAGRWDAGRGGVDIEVFTAGAVTQTTRLEVASSSPVASLAIHDSLPTGTAVSDLRPGAPPKYEWAGRLEPLGQASTPSKEGNAMNPGLLFVVGGGLAVLCAVRMLRGK